MQDYYFKNRSISEKNDTKTPIFLRPEQIIPPKTTQKRNQSLNSIIRLAESIKKYGVLEPLSVKISPNLTGEPTYELISGERRLRAAVVAGIDKIPCILLPEDDRNYAISSIVRSLQQQGLHIFEQASAFRMLIDDFSLTQEEIARKIGVSQSAVANKLRLLQLSREEQQQILNLKLSERHARTLLRLKDPKNRAIALRRIASERLTVAATEQLIDEISRSEEKELQKPAFSVILSPETPPKGVLPRKFAIPDLTPLYNSIERTLSIFRKTGSSVTCQREESPQSVRIVIEIPKNG